MANISVRDLSVTISELIDLDSAEQSTVESAVNRALSAKEVQGGMIIDRFILGYIFQTIKENLY